MHVPIKKSDKLQIQDFVLKLYVWLIEHWLHVDKSSGHFKHLSILLQSFSQNLLSIDKI